MSADVSSATLASNTTINARRRLARRSPLTILVAGSPATGKTALSDAFAGVRLADRARRTKSNVVYTAGKPTELKITHHAVDGPNEELEYSLLDVHNFGHGADSYEDIEHLTQYLEDRFNEMVAEQSRIRRDPRFKDKRVHCCLYLIDSFHGLKEFDVVAMTRLSTLTNVVPVIGRAESFTASELEVMRSRLLADCTAYKIPIFNFQDSEREQPLRVVRTNEYDEEGNAMLSLRLPFGRVDATDPAVSDFVLLRSYVMDLYAFELADNVVDILYEQYRTIRLSDPNSRYSVLEPEMLASHASRLKQEQLERESRELRVQEERVQQELEQRRRDLQERERELKILEEKLAMERALLARRNRRLSDIDENEAVATPQQLQKEFSAPPITPPPKAPAPAIPAQAAPPVPAPVAVPEETDLRHSRSVHISPRAASAGASAGALGRGSSASSGASSGSAITSPGLSPSGPSTAGFASPSSPPSSAGSVAVAGLQGAPAGSPAGLPAMLQGSHATAGSAGEGATERPVSQAISVASSEYTDFDDIRAKSRSPSQSVPPIPEQAPSTPAPPVPTTAPLVANGVASSVTSPNSSGTSPSQAPSLTPRTPKEAQPTKAAPSPPIISERRTSSAGSAKTGPILRTLGNSAGSSVYSSLGGSTGSNINTSASTTVTRKTSNGVLSAAAAAGHHSPKGSQGSQGNQGTPKQASQVYKVHQSPSIGSSSAPQPPAPQPPAPQPPTVTAPLGTPGHTPSAGTALSGPVPQTQRLKPSMMPPPSPPLTAQKSFVVRDENGHAARSPHLGSSSSSASPQLGAPGGANAGALGDIYGRLGADSHASLVTAPDLNPSSSTVDSMPGSFPGVKSVMRKTSNASINNNRRASMIESVHSGYETPPSAGIQGYGRLGNNSGSSIEQPDSPSYPPRSPNRPNSFIALDQTLVIPRKKEIDRSNSTSR